MLLEMVRPRNERKDAGFRVDLHGRSRMRCALWTSPNQHQVQAPQRAQHRLYVQPDSETVIWRHANVGRAPALRVKGMLVRGRIKQEVESLTLLSRHCRG